MYMLPIRALAPDIDLVVWNWTAWVWTAKEILTRSSAMEKMCLETCGTRTSVWEQTKDLRVFCHHVYLHQTQPIVRAYAQQLALTNHITTIVRQNPRAAAAAAAAAV